MRGGSDAIMPLEEETKVADDVHVDVAVHVNVEVGVGIDVGVDVQTCPSRDTEKATE